MGLHFLKSALSLPIPEHKEQTMGRAYEEYQPSAVYIPAVDAHNQPLKNLIAVGEKVFKGTLIGTGVDDFPVYSSVSGRVLSHKLMMMADGKVRDCLEIENDKLSQWALKPALKRVDRCTKEEIMAAIKDSGAIGFGGAGFPTYRKFLTDKPIDYIIVNAVECEPYLTTDFCYGRSHMAELFFALPYLLKLTGCKRIIFAVKKDREALIEAAKIEARKKGNRALPFVIKTLPERYPMGYERSIVREVLHKEYKALPIEAGAVVDNLYTLMTLGRRFVLGQVAADRCVTVSGEVFAPKNLLIPYGALASDLINRCGGPKLEQFVLINGGPMCGNAHDSDYVTQLQSNGVLVLKPQNTKPEPCWHCGMCIDNCPMGLQPVQIQLALKSGNVERLKKLDAALCVNCGLCSFVCPSKIDVAANIQRAKALLRKSASAQPKGGK